MNVFNARLRSCLLAVAALAAGFAHADTAEDFFIAVQRDNAGAVKSLVSRGFDVNTRSPDGQTGLYLALRNDSLKAAAAIIEAPSLQPDVANAAGENGLMMAALRGQPEMVAKLLDRGAAVNKSGWTPLHYAASGPEPKTVKLLLDRGAAIEAESPNRSTPLMLAAGYGPEASVDMLLAKGADAKRVNDLKLNAADFARKAGREKLAERLAAAAR